MKKAPITICSLLALAMIAPAEDELKIISNVLIDFGADENSYSDGWNIQAGSTYKSTQYNYAYGTGTGLKTDTLYNTTDNSATDVNVSWNAGREGISWPFDTRRPVNPTNNTDLNKGLEDVGSMNSIWYGMHKSELTVDIVEACWQQKGDSGIIGDFNLAYGDILITGLETGATYTVSAVINVAENWSLGGDTVDGADSAITLSNGGKPIESNCSFITTTQGTLELTDAGVINWEKLKDTSSFILTWVFKVSENDTTINLNVGSWLSSNSYVGISAMGITQYDNSIQDVIGGIYDSADMVPEPTTATLSLLALTALAARRRRK